MPPNANRRMCINREMIIGAILGCIIWSSIQEFWSTTDVRQEFGKSGLFLGISLIFWYGAAKSAKMQHDRIVAKNKYLEARITTLLAYQNAYSGALMTGVRDAAAQKAESNAEVREAERIEENARSAYSSITRELASYQIRSID
ncbi:MAG TPA: hypothetical protein VG796_01250 [Verrucomicrobiales bacterium]|nr:hypothetical protein [Verrucomicrobiales bacterium]